MVLGAVLAATVPIGAVAWKSYRSSTSAPLAAQASQQTSLGQFQSASMTLPQVRKSDALTDTGTRSNSLGGIQAWLEGSTNPFLTTAQAKDRKIKDALAQVEQSLMRRGDVENVFILAHDGQFSKQELLANKPKAVVSIRMRSGSLPVVLADAAGSLVSAALVHVNAEDVEVLDERTGARIRARTLDAGAALEARADFMLAADCEQEELQLALNSSAVAPGHALNTKESARTDFTHAASHQLANYAPANVPWRTQVWQSTWIWIVASIVLIGVVVGIGLWRKRWARAAKGLNCLSRNLENTALNQVNPQHAAPALGKFEFWSAPLACALHTCVAEKPALIAATLVQRLEGDPSFRQDVATMMLELEPWAAERILAVLPNHSIDVLEEAIKYPGAPACAQQVRALAEAMISLRNAA